MGKSAFVCACDLCEFRCIRYVGNEDKQENREWSRWKDRCSPVHQPCAVSSSDSLSIGSEFDTIATVARNTNIIDCVHVCKAISASAPEISKQQKVKNRFSLACNFLLWRVNCNNNQTKKITLWANLWDLKTIEDFASIIRFVQIYSFRQIEFECFAIFTSSPFGAGNR